MAYPVVEAANTYGAEAAASHAIPLPTGVQAGDLLILLVNGPADSDYGWTHPSGWSNQWNASNGNMQGAAWTRVADGSEGSTVTLDLSTAMRLSAVTLRISGADGTVTHNSGVYGTGYQPNPGSVTAPWGADDNLFIAVAHAAAGDTPTYPTGYTGYTGYTGAPNQWHARTLAAWRQDTVATEDPGAFSIDDAGDYAWIAFTLAIQPGEDAGGGGSGGPKIWDGSAWVTAGRKVWTGAAWGDASVHVRGSNWTTTPGGDLQTEWGSRDGDWFVDNVDGHDGDAGTGAGSPFASIARAVDAVTTEGSTNQVIVVRGKGALYPRSAISGPSGLRLVNYQGETPIVDPNDHNGGWQTVVQNGMIFSVPNGTVEGFIVRNAGRHGILVSGAGARIRYTAAHHCGRVGIFGFADDLLFDTCLGHSNFDYRNQDGSEYSNPETERGGNADGLQIYDHDNGRMWRCMAYRNSDDGFDTYNGTGNELDTCIAIENGYYADGTTDMFVGDGNGFKMGGGTGGTNACTRSVAMRNLVRGFTNNGSPGAVFWNDVAYDNDWAGFAMFGDKSGVDLRNNISLANAANTDGLAGVSTNSHNSWNLGITPAFLATAYPAALPTTIADMIAWFESDWFRLAVGSPGINAGADVGFAYEGAAPDLGWREAA